MQQVKGTIKSVSQRTSQKGNTVYTLEIDMGMQYPINLRTMDEPQVKDGEHTFYYDLGKPYTNQHGSTTQTKWLRSIDEAPQVNHDSNATGGLMSQVSKFDRLMTTITEVRIVANTILDLLEKKEETQPYSKSIPDTMRADTGIPTNEYPETFNNSVDVDDIPF